MSFTVLDHYKGFVSNSFIKKDISQIDLLKKISFAWDKFNKNNLQKFPCLKHLQICLHQ